jgi:hypothetical protein
MEEQEAIRDFMGDRPDSTQLRDWRETLQQRLAGMEQEKAQTGDPSGRLGSKIQQLKKQIAALSEEEAVTEFVEDSVRATLAMGRIADPINQLED